ncbi:hypothetical protein YPPY60_4848, partial [Yersinia pestis PY-60]|jgi:hypothetical protein
MVT